MLTHRPNELPFYNLLLRQSKQNKTKRLAILVDGSKLTMHTLLALNQLALTATQFNLRSIKLTVHLFQAQLIIVLGAHSRMIGKPSKCNSYRMEFNLFRLFCVRFRFHLNVGTMPWLLLLLLMVLLLDRKSTYTREHERNRKIKRKTAPGIIKMEKGIWVRVEFTLGSGSRRSLWH